ncbi:MULTISPECIES: PspA-associated protein PspAA [Brevibacterium]|uniref:PspA-associated domain-containing protein n=2 Tax=Brevibacterium TaxID=1696 RepID=A0ABP9U0W8_9MICO
MIIRIMGEGQFDVADVDQELLQKYDNQVEHAVESGDADEARTALSALHDYVVANGTPVSDDFLGTSDVVVPFVDATLEEISELLTGEGFIPDPA